MGSALRRLLPYVLQYRRPFSLGLLCVLVTTAIQLLSPWILKYAIDDLTAGITRDKLAMYAGLLVGIACVGAVFRFLMRRIMIGASRDIEYDIRNEFFAHLQRMPLGYCQARRTGDLMSRATNDLNAVRMMVGPAIMYSANTVIVFIVAIILMAAINPWLTMMALLPLPLVSISVKYFGAAIHRRFEAIQAQLSEISATVQEALAGVRVVRAYSREAHEIERFRAANDEYVRRNRRLIQLQGLYYPSMTFFLGLGSLLVLWLGSREVIRGNLSLGEFVAFNAYLVMLSWPMIAFGWVTNILQRGLASWKRMLEIVDAVPAISDEHVTDAGRVAPLSGAIEIRDLTFTYPGAECPALEDITLRVAPGETIAIVGGTGAGKSTLINLLPRLHEAPAGTVLLDGVDVREIPIARLRGAIAMAPQEPFLFSDTIAGNIAFGVPPGEPADARMRAAAAVSQLDVDVETFPLGFDTVVGERGITLSGGQKQRAALARALMVDPKILVLDDALSAVDTHTEEEILRRLRGVMRQRTSIIVAHRISTVRAADRIYVMKDGRIVEEGSHDELVRLDGLYAAMYRRQLLEEEVAAS